MQFATDVTITNSDPEAVIYYTLDGSTPTESSNLYSSPIHVMDNTVIRARAYKESFSPSKVAVGTFNIVWKLETGLPSRRYQYGAVASGGKLYYLGGITGSTSSNDVDVYDFGMKTWSQATDMPSARVYFGIVVTGGKIYCIGGAYYDSGYNYLASVEAYDISAGTWSTLSSMPNPEMEFSAVVMNGVIYCFIVREYSSPLRYYEYDIAEDIWTGPISLEGTPYSLDERVQFGVRRGRHSDIPHRGIHRRHLPVVHEYLVVRSRIRCVESDARRYPHAPQRTGCHRAQW
jgi:hypothetical protein